MSITSEIKVRFEYRPSPYHMGDYRMIIIESNVKQYPAGTTFDFGKMQIEAQNGVQITVLPSKD